MNVLEKIRDKFTEQELMLGKLETKLNTTIRACNYNQFVNFVHAGPIEEIYNFLVLQRHKIGTEEQARVDTLRYNWNEMQAKALNVQNKIWDVQDVNRKKLTESVAKFRSDLKLYVNKYKTGGPAVEGKPNAHW